jgi:hypothetical protein
MLNCKETTRLLSEGLDRRLSLWQRMNLGLHVLMCGACSAYRRQIIGLNQLLRGQVAGTSSTRVETAATAHLVSHDCIERTKEAVRKAESGA